MKRAINGYEAPFIKLLSSNSHIHCTGRFSLIFSNEKTRFSIMLQRNRNGHHLVPWARCLVSGTMLDTCLVLSRLIFTTQWWERDLFLSSFYDRKKKTDAEDMDAELRTETTSGDKPNAHSTTSSFHLSIAVSWELINGSVYGGCQTPQHLLSQSREEPAQGWNPNMLCQIKLGLSHSPPKCTP